MNYSHITNDMTWSFSRITTFEDCKYKFFLKYIMKLEGNVRNFFSDYGSFMHHILEKFLKKKLDKDELAQFYLTNFRNQVVGRAPSFNIFNNYFKQGLSFLNEIESPKYEILDVEKEISFKIGDKKFVGFIDVVSRSDGINIIDHKSRVLKPRSGETKPTASDKELDKYLRQLYMYSVAINDEFAEAPKHLIFNCFRENTVIIEPFNQEVFWKTQNWALNIIDRINTEEEWKPDIEWFKCRYLCDVCDKCEYYQMFGGDT